MFKNRDKNSFGENTMDHRVCIVRILSLFVIAFCQICFAQKETGDIDLGCAHGSYRFGNLCYMFSTLAGTFEDSELICKMAGGVMVPIKDKETHNIIQRLRIKKLLHNYWIGLNDRKVERMWEFSDGTPLSNFKRWAPGEPNNVNRNQDCAKLFARKNLLWDDDTCSRPWHYICQFEDENCTSRPETQLGSFCFELSEEAASYDRAEKNCKEKDGYLVNIKNQEIYDFVKKLIHEERRWKTMSEEMIETTLQQNKDRIPSVWIGLINNNGTWEFLDGALLSENEYINWARGEPNNAPPGEQCAVMNFQWNDISCNAHENFVCQMEPFNTCKNTIIKTVFVTDAKKTPTTPTTTTTTITTTTTKPKSVKTIEAKATTAKIEAKKIVDVFGTQASSSVCSKSEIHLSAGHFCLLIFIFFVLGVVFVSCFWLLRNHFQRIAAKCFGRKRDDDSIRMVYKDMNDDSDK